MHNVTQFGGYLGVKTFVQSTRKYVDDPFESLLQLLKNVHGREEYKEVILTMVFLWVHIMFKNYLLKKITSVIMKNK